MTQEAESIDSSAPQSPRQRLSVGLTFDAHLPEYKSLCEQIQQTIRLQRQVLALAAGLAFGALAFIADRSALEIHGFFSLARFRYRSSHSYIRLLKPSM